MFSDIHIHLLPGVDDGAQTISDMQEMLKNAYMSGTRMICCTPHYHPGYFGDNREKILETFALARGHVSENYPDMQLYLGNELRYDPACLHWLAQGECKTLNQTEYVLVDFTEREKEETITNALNQLLNAGWKPVLAHAERYKSLHGKLDVLQRYRENRVILQADTQSVFGGFGFRIRKQCIKLLNNRMIDVMSSDAHNCSSRPPEMVESYMWARGKYGKEYADVLCFENAYHIVRGDTVKRI